MKAQDIRKIAAQLLRWAEELEEKTAPDLFSELKARPVLEPVDDIREAAPVVEAAGDEPTEPIRRRTRKSVGVKMNESLVVLAAEKLGKAQGFCRRDHIESSLWRLHPDISREAIREAFNAAVTELDITCHRSGTRRCYRITQRPRIMAAVEEQLKKQAS